MLSTRTVNAGQRGTLSCKEAPFGVLTLDMASLRTTPEATADTGHGSSESDAAPKRTRRRPTTGHGGRPSGTQGASFHTPLVRPVITDPMKASTHPNVESRAPRQ